MIAYLLQGDVRVCLDGIENDSVDCCITSPPYFGLRDYGCPGQMGMEPTPEAFVAGMVSVFHEVKRVLKPEGTLWLNIGDSYARAGGWSDNPGLSGTKRGESGRARTNQQEGCNGQRLPPGLKQKDLIGIPWMLAFALRADGWYLRQDIIWHKPSPMPESVTDRCTKSHEYVFLLSKSERYFYDHEAVKEDAVKGAAGSNFHTGKTGEHQLGWASTKPRIDAANRKALGTNSSQTIVDGKRNRRDVWTIPTKPFKGAHFAVMPEALVEPCLLAGCPEGGTVLDPFSGSGTVGVVAHQHGRNYVGCELNPAYVQISHDRLRAAGAEVQYPFAEPEATA
jgi:DNA modification methylase